MDLPKELLVQIIGHALISPSPITLRKPHENRWAKELDSLRPTPASNERKRRRTRKSPLSKILLICRDFYFAGLEAYYGGNVFHFDTPLDFRDLFIETLSDRHKACVKQVIVDWEWHFLELPQPRRLEYFSRYPAALREDLLEDFAKLESTVINCWMRKEPVFVAAASRADRAKSEIQRQVLAALPSNASQVKFVFPRSWGILTDM